MPLQNRVDPSGEIHAVSARGTMMGNRGRIHDPETQSLLQRRWMLKAWLICVNEFKGRHRQVMGLSYTELFFLDEVTALAAGHRPCFECRRKAAKAYQAAWKKAQNLDEPPKVAIMDPELHGERLDGRKKRHHLVDRDSLPDAAIIMHDKKIYAVREGHLLLWSFDRYQLIHTSLHELLPNQVVCLTPPSTLAVLNNGYQPIWHESADHQPAIR